MNNTNEIGYLTVAAGTTEERQVLIVNRAAFCFADNRIISVCELQDEYGYYIEINNAPESGRQNNQLWLSKVSYMGLQAALNLYSLASNWDMQKHTDVMVGSETFDYLIQGETLTDPFKKHIENE